MEDTLSKLQATIVAVAAGNRFVNMTESCWDNFYLDEIDTDHL